MGRWAPGLPSQDPHWSQGTHAHNAPGGWPSGVSKPRRKRVRHIRCRPFQHLNQCGPGHDGRQPHAGPRPPQHRRHWRWRHDRRYGIRSPQPCGSYRRQCAGHSQRQQYVDLQQRRRFIQLLRSHVGEQALQLRAHGRQARAVQNPASIKGRPSGRRIP